MEIKKIISIAACIALFSSLGYSQKRGNIEKIDSLANIDEKNCNRYTQQKDTLINPSTQQSIFLTSSSTSNDYEENSIDEFGEEEENDFEIPSCELYNYSWNHDRLNPYQIKIEDIQDSIKIDCSGFVFPIKKEQDKVITSKFGARRHRYHYGTDIGLKRGDTIVAAFDGTVRIVDYEARGFGHYVVIRHNNGLESLYAHMSKSLVKIDQKVKAGELIGLGGSTGRSSGPHLHLEFRFLGNAFNTNKIINYDTEECYSDAYYITKNETFKHKKDLDNLKSRRYHRVKKGETLSHIAKRYGTTVSRLCKLNHISRTTTIRIGRSIRYR